MAVAIYYSYIAKDNLRDIFLYIKKDSLKYAFKEIALVRGFIKSLKNNIYLGKRFELMDDDVIREVIFRNYRIIYEVVSKQQLHILTIHHHSRSISNNPAFNQED